MFSNKHIYILIVFALITSCIDEDNNECSYTIEINIDILDKHYKNESLFDNEIISKLQMPTRTIQNIYYTLQDVSANNNIILSGQQNAMNLPGSLELDVSSIPEGDYALTVWGSPDPEGKTGELHRDEKEQTDLFMAHKTITIGTNRHETINLNMQRTKGQLFIIFNNLSQSMVQISEEVTNISNFVTQEFNYQESTNVKKEFSGANTGTIVLQTLLAPTVKNNISNISLQIYSDDEDEPIDKVIELEAIISRNSLTGIILNHNVQMGEITAWIFIDGKWSIVKHLELN